VKLKDYRQRVLVMITNRINRTRIAPVEVKPPYPPANSPIVDSSFVIEYIIRYAILPSLTGYFEHKK
jgi:hypothetical protein